MGLGISRLWLSLARNAAVMRRMTAIASEAIPSKTGG
jgi:hypothetical protein